MNTNTEKRRITVAEFSTLSGKNVCAFPLTTSDMRRCEHMAWKTFWGKKVCGCDHDTKCTTVPYT